MSELYYKTHHLARQIEPKGEVFKKPSQTVEGESETIAELFRKFQNGIPIRTKPRSEDDYVTLDHNDPNFKYLKPQSDPLTAKDEVVIPTLKRKEKEPEPPKAEPPKSE